MQLFYNDSLKEDSTDLNFSREESKHITKVLRKKEGDTLHITNGHGILFTAILSFANQSKCVAKIETSIKKPSRNYRIHLAVAPTKMNDRYEWFLEKATEFGIDEITPIICDHSERTVIKEERFQRILISAMKQSLQCYLPKLNKAITLTEFINHKHEGELFIAHCEDGEKKSLHHLLQPRMNATILIGPEGDFSINEISLALANKYNSITLGNTRLRTESAAIAVVHSAAIINNL